MAEYDWIVWSEEHGAWRGPGRIGYTRSLHAAARFTEKGAREIEANANRHRRPGSPPNEIAMPYPKPPGEVPD
jgi:hypothetical protein